MPQAQLARVEKESGPQTRLELSALMSRLDKLENLLQIHDALLARSGGKYTIDNLTTDRNLDCDSTTTAELADVVGTLVSDLQDQGVVK